MKYCYLLLIAVIGLVAAQPSVTTVGHCYNSTALYPQCSGGYEASQTLEIGACTPLVYYLCNSSSSLVAYVKLLTVNAGTFNFSIFSNPSCAGAALEANVIANCSGTCDRGYTTTCNQANTGEALQNEAPVSGLVTGESYNYYTYTPTTETFNIEIIQDTSTSLSFVYVGQGYFPSFRKYQYAITGTNQVQIIQITGSGTFNIAVYGYYSDVQNAYTIAAFDNVPEPLEQGEIYNGTLSSGVAQNFSVEIGENVLVASFVVRVSEYYNAPRQGLYLNGTLVFGSSRTSGSTACFSTKFPSAGTYIYSVISSYTYDFQTVFYENPRNSCSFNKDEAEDVEQEIKIMNNNKSVKLI